MKKKLAERKEEEARRTQEDEAVQKVVEGSQMEIPDVMVNTQAESMVDDFANRISQQGLSLEQYVQFSGTSVEQMLEQMKPEALKRIQAGLVLEAVAVKEEIEVTEEDVNAEITRMAEQYGMEPDTMKDWMGESEKENLKKDLAVQKAVKLIMEYVEEKDAE